MQIVNVFQDYKIKQDYNFRDEKVNSQTQTMNGYFWQLADIKIL